MMAYQLAFPETRDESPYNVLGPLTARLGVVRTSDGRAHVVTGATVIDTSTPDIKSATQAAVNPAGVGGIVSGFMSSNDVWRRTLFVLIGVAILIIALVRLTRA